MKISPSQNSGTSFPQNSPVDLPKDILDFANSQVFDDPDIDSQYSQIIGTISSSNLDFAE